MGGNNKCFVINCRSNYNLAKDGYVSVYQAKTQEQAWRINLPKREGVIFDGKKHKVCARHFAPDCFRVDRILYGGEWVYLPMSKKILNADAVPTIFPGLPNHKIKSPAKRKAPRERIYIPQDMLKKAKLQKAPQVPPPPVVIEEKSTASTDPNGMNASEVDNSRDSPPSPKSLFEMVLESLETNKFFLPRTWKDFISRRKDIINICKFELVDDISPKKNNIEIILENNGDRCVRACGRTLAPTHELSVDLSNVTDCKLLQTLINKIEGVFKACHGSAEENGVKNSPDCHLVIARQERPQRCLECKKEKKRIYSDKKFNESKKVKEKEQLKLQKEEIKKLNLTIKSMTKKAEELEAPVPHSVIKLEIECNEKEDSESTETMM